MARAGRVVGTGVLIVVLTGGAYVTADAYDMVPGLVTLAPVPADPSPFPTAPGALTPTAAAPVLGAPDPEAPMPLAGSVQAQVDALVADARVGATTGVVVADRLTGEVLATHLPDGGRIPASTAKLATAVAALAALDPQETLPTRVVAGASASDLVLVGGGDMMLAAGAGDGAAVVGHAGLADLADQVAKGLALRGTTSVTLRFDDSLFSGPTTNPGWATSDVSNGYVAPVTALAVDIAATKPGVEYPPRYADPSLAAARAFADRLTEHGITVAARPTRTTAAPGAQVLGEVRSATLDQIVQYVLDTSDNTIAEVLSRLVALGAGLPASFDGGTQAVLHELATLGVDTTGAHLADASGLASGSVLAPRQLVAVLALAMDPTHPTLRDVAAGMPIAGLTGTLADRFTTSPARGVARAKTGSLHGVTSLAGTVETADGRWLLFAVMADATPPGGQTAPRQAIDAFVTYLAGCGC